nr:hypothetical protein [Tern adenovirus]
MCLNAELEPITSGLKSFGSNFLPLSTSNDRPDLKTRSRSSDIFGSGSLKISTASGSVLFVVFLSSRCCCLNSKISSPLFAMPQSIIRCDPSPSQLDTVDRIFFIIGCICYKTHFFYFL